MARIKIDLPAQFNFSTMIPLRITDINYGGHLANDAVLGIVHEARIQLLKSMNYSEMNIEDNAIIMTDAVILYKSQGYYGDKVQVQMAVVDFSGVGFDIICLLNNMETGKEIARVKTGMAFFDYSTNRLTSVPDKFKKRFQQP